MFEGIQQLGAHPGVFQGDGGGIGHVGHNLEFLPAEILAVQPVEHLDNPGDLVIDDNRHADDGLGPETGGIIDELIKIGVLPRVIDDQGFAVTGYPPGDTGLAVDVQAFQVLRHRAIGELEIELLGFFIEEEEGGSGGPEGAMGHPHNRGNQLVFLFFRLDLVPDFFQEVEFGGIPTVGFGHQIGPLEGFRIFDVFRFPGNIRFTGGIRLVGNIGLPLDFRFPGAHLVSGRRRPNLPRLIGRRRPDALRQLAREIGNLHAPAAFHLGLQQLLRQVTYLLITATHIASGKPEAVPVESGNPRHPRDMVTFSLTVILAVRP